MGILMKHGTEPGEFGIRVAEFYADTYSCVASLVAAMEYLTETNGLHCQPKSIGSGPSVATQPWPSAPTEVVAGQHYTVSWAEGDRAGDLVSVVTNAPTGATDPRLLDRQHE